MSRGPGRVQRAILEAVSSASDESGSPRWVTVDEVLLFRFPLSVDRVIPGATQSTLSQRETVRRGMRVLAEAGRIELGDVADDRPADQDWYWHRTVTRYVLAARRPLSREERIRELEQKADAAEQKSHLYQAARTRTGYDSAISEMERAEALRAEANRLRQKEREGER